MKINEVITKKERVDEVLPAVIGAGVHAARLAAPYALRYGKKAWDYGKKLLPGLKKAKAASHGLGGKIHAAGEVGKKIVKKSPPTPGDGSEFAKTDMVPGPQAYHKKAVAGAGISPNTNPTKAVGPMSNLERKRLR